jgi:predicted kinase
MLIILSGLPGVGKTTIAHELARQIGAVHIRIDSIEQALCESGGMSQPVGDLGYRVGYALAADNLLAGLTVIADSVNPLAITRDAWLAVAHRASVPAAEVEIVCSDLREHQHRVETRGCGPSWREVAGRLYEPWRREHMVIDTAGESAPQSVAILRAGIGTL